MCVIGVFDEWGWGEWEVPYGVDCAGVMGVVLWWNPGRYEGCACGGWKKGRRGHARSGVEVGEVWGRGVA